MSSQVTEHIKCKHTGDKPYECVACEEQFSERQDLAKHRKAHMGSDMYACIKCDCSFSRALDLNGNMKNHKDWEITTAGQQNVNTNNREIESEIVTQVHIDKKQCITCDISFPEILDLNAHVKCSHVSQDGGDMVVSHKMRTQMDTWSLKTNKLAKQIPIISHR